MSLIPLTSFKVLQDVEVSSGFTKGGSPHPALLITCCYEYHVSKTWPCLDQTRSLCNDAETAETKNKYTQKKHFYMQSFEFALEISIDDSFKFLAKCSVFLLQIYCDIAHSKKNQSCNLKTLHYVKIFLQPLTQRRKIFKFLTLLFKVYFRKLLTIYLTQKRVTRRVVQNFCLIMNDTSL